MKKKLLSIVALASLMVLGGCGNKESANPTDTPTPKPTENTRPTESTTPNTSTTPVTTEPTVATAETRHRDYLENYKTKGKEITIQGKVVHAVSYSGSANCNIAIQEGKYGYWMNNVPKTSVEIGKSYVFTGTGSGKSYPSLNMTGGTVTPTDDIEAAPLTLGADTNVFEDSKDAYAKFPKVELSSMKSMPQRKNMDLRSVKSSSMFPITATLPKLKL